MVESLEYENFVGSFIGDLLRALEEFVSGNQLFMTAIRWINASIVWMAGLLGFSID